MTFSPAECREAGLHTRNLANWSRARLATVDAGTNAIHICPHRRADQAETAEADRKLARRKLRECRLIMQSMRRHPGFIEGWKAA